VAFPLPHVTDVIPEPLKSVFTKGGKGISRAVKATADPPWTHAIQPAWNAYVKADPVGAEMIRQMNPNSPLGLLSLGTILVPGSRGMGKGPTRFGATPAQNKLLDAIRRSSLQRPWTMGQTQGLGLASPPTRAPYLVPGTKYDPTDASVVWLSQFIGGPHSKQTLGDVAEAINPRWPIMANPEGKIAHPGTSEMPSASQVEVRPGPYPYEGSWTYKGTPESQFGNPDAETFAADMLFRILMGARRN